MKILYINALYSPYVAGGAEISLKLIVESMQAKGHEVVVLSLVQQEGIHNDVIDGVRVYRVGLRNYYWPFAEERPGTFKRLAWHLRDRYNAAIQTDIKHVLRLEHPDVVSCHNLVGWSVSVWDEVAKAGVPIVQVLHDMYLLCANSNMYKKGKVCNEQCFRCHILRSGHRRRSRQVKAVIGISKSILNRFTAAGYFNNVSQHVIYNARHIPTSRHRRIREAGSPLKIGYIGALSIIKGVEWLIHQFRKTAIAGSLQIAGSGKVSDVHHLKALAAGDPRITFVGYVNAADFYSSIDVLVVPSRWEEPLGMVAVEALANNLPVVSSYRGGLSETIIHGKNGLFCEPEDPDSLGNALTLLWRDTVLYNQLAECAAPSVASFLDTDRMASEYERVLYAVTKE